MKKQFTVPVSVEAYSQADAQAKMDLLLQFGAFIKDFNLNSLAGTFVSSFLTSKVAELTEKKRLQRKEKRAGILDLATLGEIIERKAQTDMQGPGAEVSNKP